MKNLLILTHELNSFLEDLRHFSGEKLATEELPEFMHFAEHYFSRYPMEDIVGRHLTDMFGCVYQLWRFLCNFDGDNPKLQLFNPELDLDGWVCPHTVLIILQNDMPFLVDSIRIELNRRNIAIHTIKSTVLMVQRDEKNKFVKLHDVGEEGNSTHKEALVYLEINLLTEEDELKGITQSLLSVLAELVTVVHDFQPMLQAVQAAENNLHYAKESVAAANVIESQKFLTWLSDNNFTFLGYKEYNFVKQGNKKFLRENNQNRLGIFAFKRGTEDYSEVGNLHPGIARFHLAPQVLTFSKSSVRSRIHRQAYSDYVVVKRFDAKGEMIGEVRFLGLYTSNVYTMSPSKIPLVRDKVGKVFDRSGLNRNGHDGKILKRILETFPRDELFLSNNSELYDTVTGVAQINERYQVRLFMRRDPFGKFISCLIYIPRDVFTTQIRLSIQALIGQTIHATECEFNTYFSESILARVHLVFKIDQHLPLEYDQAKLESRIREMTRSWEDHLHTSLIESFGEEKAMRVLAEYRNAFSSSYKENFESRTAVHDITSIAELKTENDIAMSFYQPVGAQPNIVRFKIFRKGATIELSDIIPVLEHLGLRVLSENPYSIQTQSDGVIWLHDFQLSYNLPYILDVLQVKSLFQEAFSAIWHKKTDNDSFNKLVLSAELNWREVFVLRAYASYMRQTLFNFSEHYIADALVSNRDITRQLIALFNQKFNPAFVANVEQATTVLDALREAIVVNLNAVQNLNEDRILRRFLMLINGSLRTNYFQPENGGAKNYLSIKLSPRTISDIPEPRPLYEIFIYSLRVEGVHLRGGKVARGGLRWSDRIQDYRTEVLGLVKAQQVKNAVIVPSGAKGGFVCKQMPQPQSPQPSQNVSREAIQMEGIECYKIFVRGLLDLTDNIVDGKVFSPPNVVRYDDDDPYLVVAADKGTSTFSDIANDISAEYKYWLGDAFASGGSQGYDHKGMGITARGAWISVMRHFKEKDINIQQQDFTVMGIGDMAGDVFGNGMLLSKHICLVAAFNHMHILIDPNPDSTISFVERQRLFTTPKTGWGDYDKTLISAGGGIFNRDAKFIHITAEMKQRFDIHEETLTPAELMNCLLKAPIDLIWNGGIGTYVKSSNETHADVGDKANDNVRINGNQLRCKVFGEGGNLGMTQRGRIEYCLAGGMGAIGTSGSGSGACNTDFIDNAGGVDCSDHEVNIKILLNEIVSSGDLTAKQRNKLLVEMTDNVAQLVLKNIYRQTQAISIAETESLARSVEYRRFMTTLESQKRLSRRLEFLPTDDVLLERQTHNRGLTRPELAILISYAKAVLKEDLTVSDIADDIYMVAFIESAFPQKVAQLYPQQLYHHRLRREIVATQVANDMVNNMGISFAQRLIESTGAKAGDVAKAYVVARDIYRMESFVQGVQELDYKVPAKLQIKLLIGMIRRVRRATRWFLRNRRSHIEPAIEVNLFAPVVSKITEQLPQLLKGDSLEVWTENVKYLQKSGIPEYLILHATETSYLYSGLSVAEAARRSGRSLELVTAMYFLLGEYLSLPWFATQISDLHVETFWQAMARETYMDDLESQLRALTISLVHSVSDTVSIDAVIQQWSLQQTILIQRWKVMVNELQASSGTDFAVFSVALRDLLDLAQATQHSKIEL